MDVTGATSTSSQTSVEAMKQSSNPVSEDFNTFLTLLTAQIRNQDPLAPLDSTQFVEQLATFSSLEQQVRTNDQLESISLMIAEMYSNAAGEWVGQDAAVTTSWLPYQGGEVDFTADIPMEADQALMVIRDTSGEVIDTQSLDPAQSPWSWDGKTANNADADHGLYQMVIELYQGGQPLGMMEPKIISKVTQASIENGEVMLGFENRMTQSAAKVTRIAGE
ncbi:flagellar biosynthesis protein FlgD [Parvularcula flava]|uniref:Basal-body rod modification protein FlgD n=1 Tax=Aquisalinus luteolus TaxID=1566827 RepID=A0A8J3A024_9PROT|nr:flagellar hook capping FlgD N-terminal domain-containing protein [Aquisalinus luteolus]NHK26328.1 flagellar biosynthesis protein FlgD [Aquisalinus luteolus]GGH92001.1 basal-body rod modification protein FlgD [Aquisalinus luteolus]